MTISVHPDRRTICAELRPAEEPGGDGEVEALGVGAHAFIEGGLRIRLVKWTGDLAVCGDDVGIG